MCWINATNKSFSVHYIYICVYMISLDWYKLTMAFEARMNIGYIPSFSLFFEFVYYLVSQWRITTRTVELFGGALSPTRRVPSPTSCLYSSCSFYYLFILSLSPSRQRLWHSICGIRAGDIDRRAPTARTHCIPSWRKRKGCYVSSAVSGTLPDTIEQSNHMRPFRATVQKFPL